MDRLALFMTAKSEAQSLYRKFPQVKTIESIINQMSYLISLVAGEQVDRSRLPEIVVGIQAAREIEPLDVHLAETLYAVSEEVKMMRLNTD